VRLRTWAGERELVADSETELVRMELVHPRQVHPSALSYRYDIEDDAQRYLDELTEEGVCAPWSEYEQASIRYERPDDQATFDLF